ncbi:MAG TPA: hypothetical protein VEH62_05755 [Gemmatimonadales bacterium]|nr:hypothetical protein [Gemmatimonadales bacterium]
MKRNPVLAIASLLSILLMSLHLADDIVRGMEPGGVADLVAVPVLVAWLYGTLVLAERRSGVVIIVLGSLLALAVPLVHFQNAGGVAGGRVAGSSGALFFVWTQIALGVTALFSLVLGLRELWRAGRGRGAGGPTA